MRRIRPAERGRGGGAVPRNVRPPAAIPRQSPPDATASSLRGATRWNERLHRSASGTSSPDEAATQSGSTTMFRRVAARSTRSRANSRHVPHPRPAPSRSATRSANEADAPVSGSEANAVAASTSSRSVTRLQRQTYTARPVRLRRERMVNENDWNLQHCCQHLLETPRATAVPPERAAGHAPVSRLEEDLPLASRGDDIGPDTRDRVSRPGIRALPDGLDCGCESLVFGIGNGYIPMLHERC